MYLIISEFDDASAVGLARLWRSHNSILMTPRDLSVGGWAVFPGGEEPSTFVASGTLYRASDIEGVVVRLAGVSETELVHIAVEDRPYAAAEMTAFLLAWLSSLQVPVVNTPTACSLCGPNWTREKWVHEAWRLGISVRNRKLVVVPGSSWPDEPDERLALTLSVVGGHCIDNCHPVLADAAVELAGHVGATLLSVRFSAPEVDGCLLDAHPWPDVGRADIAEVLLEHMRNHTRRPGSQ